MDALAQILTKINDPTVLVLLLVCGGLFLERRESSKRTADSLDKLASAITDMRVELARQEER